MAGLSVSAGVRVTSQPVICTQVADSFCFVESHAVVETLIVLTVLKEMDG